MELNSPNFQIFRDCLAGPLIQKSSTTTTSVDKRTRKGGRKGKKNGSALREIAYDNEGPSDADELAEFIDVCYSPRDGILSLTKLLSTSRARSSLVFPARSRP